MKSEYLLKCLLHSTVVFGFVNSFVKWRFVILYSKLFHCCVAAAQQQLAMMAQQAPPPQPAQQPPTYIAAAIQQPPPLIPPPHSSPLPHFTTQKAGGKCHMKAISEGSKNHLICTPVTLSFSIRLSLFAY